MPTRSWAVSEAKAKFSDLVDAAERGEPQIVTRHGVEAVVVLSAKIYRSKLKGDRGSLVEFFARSPYRDVTVAPPRNRQTGRDIDL